MYSVQITAGGHIIDKDQIRVRNIQTAEGMLNELKTIMEFI
jgi:predicted ABC-type ATPase